MTVTQGLVSNELTTLKKNLQFLFYIIAQTQRLYEVFSDRGLHRLF